MMPLIALSCALAEHKPYSIGDSYISELATRENLRLNRIDESSVKFLDSTADYPQQPGVVLIKVPKTLALLEQQLRALRKVVTSDTRIIAGAKARDIHTSTLELFEKVLGPTTTTLAWKKARLINCTFNEPPLADAPQTVSWKLEGTDWTIHNHAECLLPAPGWILAHASLCNICQRISKVRLSISAVVTALLA